MNNEKKKKGFLDLFIEREAPSTEKAILQSTEKAIILEVDEDIKIQLTNVLSENNLQGYDFLEFRDALKNTEKHIPDEAARYNATFAAVSSMISVDKLMETADFYLEKLKEKKSEFDQYVQTLLSKITTKEKQAKEIDDEISKLNKQINDLQTKKMEILNETVAEKTKVDKGKITFESTYQNVVNNIEQEKQKIKLYLKK